MFHRLTALYHKGINVTQVPAFKNYTNTHTHTHTQGLSSHTPSNGVTGFNPDGYHESPKEAGNLRRFFCIWCLWQLHDICDTASFNPLLNRKLVLYVTGITQPITNTVLVRTQDNNIHCYFCSSSGVFMAYVQVNLGFGCISWLPVTDSSEMVTAFLHILQLPSSSEDEKVQHNFQNSTPLGYSATQYVPQQS